VKLDSRLLLELPVLAAVIDAGSFVKAGKALGLSQSAVSRAVQRLEEKLGTRLMDRNPKTLRLTESGRQFCAEVLPLLARLEEAAQETAQAAAAVRGKLRLNVDPTFARLVLIPRLQSFLDAHPDLHIELVIREEVGDLISDGFDAALRFAEPRHSSLITRRILQVCVLTCAAPAYLQRRGRPRLPTDLAKDRHDCLLFRDPASGVPFPWEFHQGKKVITVPVSGRLIISDPATYLEACLAGVGIAQVFDLGTEPLRESGGLVDLFPAWSDERFPLNVYYPSRHFVPARLRTFLDFVASIGAGVSTSD
jgi:DNA-binding transcriptional LysR family regulator